MRGLSLPFLGILGAVEAFISDNADLPAFCQQPKQNNQRSRSLSTPAVRDLASIPVQKVNCHCRKGNGRAREPGRKLFLNHFVVRYEQNPLDNRIDCIIVITADG
jgi:hypothetical protein